VIKLSKNSSARRSINVPI